jgi:P pilus assembly protein, pilin FimA
MNKKFVALSIALSAATLSSSAFAALDGGQISFAGLVSDNTCNMSVNNGAQDAEIQLETATVTEVKTAGEVKSNAIGAKPKAFAITVDCSASGTAPSDADLVMTSQFRSNSQGTLDNDLSIDNPAQGVNLAIHQLDTKSGSYTKVNVDGEETHRQSFDADLKATWSFVASYVAQNTAVTQVAAGFVKTNAAYTLTYN